MFTDIAFMPQSNNRSSKRNLHGMGQQGMRAVASLDLSTLGEYEAGGWCLKDCLMASFGRGSMTGMTIGASHDCDGCQLATPPPYMLVLDVSNIKDPKLKAFTDKDTELAAGEVAPEGCPVCVEVHVC